MPPKRKDAGRKAAAPSGVSTRTSVGPTSQSNGKSASGVPPQQPASSRRLARARIFRRMFRVFMIGSVLMWAKPRLFPSKSSKAGLEDVAGAQHEESFEEIRLDPMKRGAIQDAFKHSWSAYERDAFGFDDYHPISHKGSNMSPKGPVGYFIVDALDSLLLMGSREEYARAREWVKSLSFDVDDKFHNFEITIRVLGGLLSAYHMAGNDTVYLEKAVDLADRLMPVFDSPSGLPYSFINLKTRIAIPDADNRGMTSVAEAGTLQLELRYLSELTGDPRYWNKAEKVLEIIRSQPSKDGLVPIFLSPETGKFMMSDIRLGSRGDSYYEYLYKMYLQTNRTQSIFRDMHVHAMQGIKTNLLKASETKRLMYTSEFVPRRNMSTGQLSMIAIPKQDHLVCFLGASLLLGVTDVQSAVPPAPEAFTEEWQKDDLYVAKALIRGCVDTYNSSKTGLAPEIVNYYVDAIQATTNGRDWYINSRTRAVPGAAPPAPPIDARNILRPETVESLFVAYRLTGDPIYRTWGWQIFQAFEKHCKLISGGYASVRDVDQVPVEHEDRMETFWLSETLKYLYLLFSGPDVLPLNEYVFNTEAHPLPIFTPTVQVDML